MSQVLFVEHETDTRARVVGIHHKPEQLTSEQIAAGILIEGTLPAVPAVRAGQIAVMIVNPQTAEVWWETQGTPEARWINVRVLAHLLGLSRTAELMAVLDNTPGFLEPHVSAGTITLLAVLLRDLRAGVNADDPQAEGLMGALVAGGAITQAEAGAIMAYGL